MNNVGVSKVTHDKIILVKNYIERSVVRIIDNKFLSLWNNSCK